MENKKFNVGVGTIDDQQSRGITLIALIITIIVLLILAGVSISLLTGQDSIIGKAKQAKNEYETVSQNEADTMNSLMETLSGIGGGTAQGSVFDPSKVSATVTEGELTAPIPVGWTVSQIPGENTISGGLVIYEGTITDWTDIDTLQTTTNQYVWIPVTDINSMVMCRNNAEGSVCHLELQGDNFVCTTHTGENTAALCGRLYGEDNTHEYIGNNTIYQTDMNFTTTNQTFIINSDYREPDAVSDYDEYFSITGEQLQNDFNEMSKSVAKYKGFYIGRYEAGEAGATKKNQNVITGTASTSGNYIGVNYWYGLYNTIRDIDQPIVDRHMIWRQSV